MSTGPWGRVLIGRVVKTAMQKTMLVRCERMKMMKKTNRLVARHRNFMVHDEASVCKIGDTVQIKEIRRMSKHKKHDLVQIVRSDHHEMDSLPTLEETVTSATQ
jgi:small subunit ribosomal protein S17